MFKHVGHLRIAYPNIPWLTIMLPIFERPKLEKKGPAHFRTACHQGALDVIQVVAIPPQAWHCDDDDDDDDGY